ncbi:unnamed protein product [Oppiella nova]|uniref:Innexin n=1 Tax=Oppiella nova TaxID=334625 RepID=A0A7R9M4C5_9ACAR|nr:unnamed protein product [Oppiella nova]CAG2170539.1 unnamed protein product [Oppiella nova]
MVVSDTVCIDNLVFRLHYKATIIGLTVAAIIVSSLHLFGYTIHCMGKDNIPSDVMSAQCWLRSTFRLPFMGNTGYTMFKNTLRDQEMRDDTLISVFPSWEFLVTFKSIPYFVYCP